MKTPPVAALWESLSDRSRLLASASTAEPGADAHHERRFAMVVTVVFLAVVIPVMMHHEMWRDELQAWLLARNTTIGGLFHALRYEGHPALWYLALRALAPLSADPRTIQWLSVACGSATVYLFALLAPLPRVVRALFPFGYFIAYGYTIVARSYALEMLIAVALCALATRVASSRGVVRSGIALFLLANVTIYGAILVLAFIGATQLVALFGGRPEIKRGIDDGTAKHGARSALGDRLRPTLVPTALGLLGVGLAVVQVWPPADAPYRGNGLITAASGLPQTHVSLAYRLTPMWRAFVPIPPLDNLGDVWQGDMLLNRSPRAEPVEAVLSLMTVAVLVAVLWRSPFAATFFALATVGTFLFSLLFYAGALYHHGHFFLAFVMALWLAAADPGWLVRDARELRIAKWVAAHRMPIVTALLLVQVAGAGARIVTDYRYPFSAGEAVAAFLQANTPSNTIVAAYPGFNGSTVAGYLGRPVYQLNRGRFATFTPFWVPYRKMADSQLVAAVRECCLRPGIATMLLVNHALKPESVAPPLIVAFTQSMVPSERYYVYRVSAQ